MSTLTPLRFIRTDNGNCRVYYRGPREHHGAIYCFQAAPKRGAFELFVCTSSDGEPVRQVPHATFAIDRWPEDNSATASEFAAWASENIMPTTEEQDR